MRSNKTQLDPDQMTMTPPNGCPFKVEDIVAFTNDYGVTFHNRKIVGFALPQNVLLSGGCVYLEKDAYWFPNKVESLTLEIAHAYRMNV